MKKSIGFLLAISLFGVGFNNLQAQEAGATENSGHELFFRWPLKSIKSKWLSLDPVYGEWNDVGGHYGCNEWFPSTGSVDYGVDFQQSRQCDQGQERLVTFREKNPITEEVVISGTKTESQVVKRTEAQMSTGVYRDWQPTSSSYTAWIDYGSTYGYSSWSPEAGTQTSDFTQTRSYNQNQERYEQNRERDSVTGDVRDVGDEVRHTKVDTRNQSRLVNVDYGVYSNSAGKSCGSWSPSIGSQTSNFSQSRSCTQSQERERSYEAGGTLINTVTETRDVSSTENRSISVSYSSWTDSGSLYSCDAWSPTPGSQTYNYSQSRICRQNQRRNRYYRVSSTNIKTVSESRVVNSNQSRSVKISYGGWSFVKNHSYSSYSPSTNNVCIGESLTQTRSYKRRERRTRYHKVGTTTIHSTYNYRDINKTQSRTVSGTKSCYTWQSVAGGRVPGPSYFKEPEIRGLREGESCSKKGEVAYSYKDAYPDNWYDETVFECM